MRVSEAEKTAINTVVGYGERYGFGNLISHLRTAWAKSLMEHGLPPDGAHGGTIMPFQMHDDICQQGFWDETGKRYAEPEEPSE